MLSNVLLIVGVPLIAPFLAYSGVLPPPLGPADRTTPTVVRQEAPLVEGLGMFEEVFDSYPERLDTDTTDTEALEEEAWFRGAREGLGREVDQPTVMIGVLSQRDVVERFLVEDAYVYLPQGHSNPMMIPWRRQDVIASELQESADQLIRQGEFERAIDIYRRIVNEMPGSRYATDAQRRIQQAQAEIRARDAPVIAGPDQPREERQRELPSAVALGVSGILWSDEPGVFLGDALLRVGEPVPGYEEVVVARITRHEVVFVFDDREHTVRLDFGETGLRDLGAATP